MNDTTEDIGHLAERLNRLFEEVRSPTGKPYSLRQVVDGVNAQAGQRVLSVQHLCQLRHGQRRKPNYLIIFALAHWFGVDPDYFSRCDDGQLNLARTAMENCSAAAGPTSKRSRLSQ